jgi:hypothetical protein
MYKNREFIYVLLFDIFSLMKISCGLKHVAIYNMIILQISKENGCASCCLSTVNMSCRLFLDLQVILPIEVLG